MPRCAWAGASDSALARYHDEVWGTRTYDASAMFEALTLGVFQAGLSWSIVFGKRDAFRRAFHDFDIAQIAAMTARDVDRLLQDPSIIRNRAKIQATIDNARVMRSASPSLVELAQSYASTRKRAPRSVADLPKSTPQADALAKQLKSQGYRFVGSHQRVRLHAERRRGQRPHSWLLPSHRLRPAFNEDQPPLRTGDDRAVGGFTFRDHRGRSRGTGRTLLATLRTTKSRRSLAGGWPTSSLSLTRSPRPKPTFMVTRLPSVVGYVYRRRRRRRHERGSPPHRARTRHPGRRGQEGVQDWHRREHRHSGTCR